MASEKAERKNDDVADDIISGDTTADVTALGESPREPESEEERVIARVWTALLGVADPPANVSFFELGGYSLALMRVAAQLQEAFGLSIPMPDLFENITVESQAKLVERLYDEQLAKFID